jgi:zinc protease
MTHPAVRVCTALLLALTASANALAGPVETSRLTLPNGLRVVLAPDSSANAVDATLWFPAGTRHEKSGQQGLALFAARLGFIRGETDPLAPITALGGSAAPAVTPDLTSWSVTLPAGALESALEFLASRLVGAPVTAAAVASERAAYRADRVVRTPVARGLASLWAAAWPGHPYARTGAAPTPPPATVGAAAVEQWRRERLGAGSAVLVVSGAFDADSAAASIRTRFARAARGGAPALAAPASPAAARRASEPLGLPARLCLVGWRAPAASDPDAPACELLAAWLGGGPSAALSATLVEDWGLAVTTQAGFQPQQAGSLLWTLVVVRPDADSAAVERTLFDTVRRAATAGPDASELERARRQWLTGVRFGLQTARQRGQALGEAEMLAGDAAVAAKRLERLETLQSADVQRAAARVFQDGARAVVWLIGAPTEEER